MEIESERGSMSEIEREGERVRESWKESKRRNGESRERKRKERKKKERKKEKKKEKKRRRGGSTATNLPLPVATLLPGVASQGEKGRGKLWFNCRVRRWL